MNRAEDDLRGGDLPGAIDNQSQALDALREGMQNLGEALAQQNRQPAGPGGENGFAGPATPPPPTDPLGRNEGQGGATGGETLLDRDALRKRSQDLMDEIQRRQSELDRPDNERGYLKRLLEQF